MALSSGLVFVALCLLYIVSSVELKYEVPMCEQLGSEGLGEHERNAVVNVFNKALKNVDYTEYSCPLEISAKFFVYMPNHIKWYDVDVLRYEVSTTTFVLSMNLNFESLVEEAVQEWSPNLEMLTGTQALGCNYGVSNGKTTLVCLVGPAM